MSFRARNRDARYNRRLRKMEVLDTETDGTPIALVCSDNTRRLFSKTGKEGAQQAAADQVGVKLVRVAEPRLPKHITDREQGMHIALERFHAIADQLSLTAERDENGYYVRPSLTRREAIKRYGRETNEVCEMIPGGR
jgi:hypothetical protein